MIENVKKTWEQENKPQLTPLTLETEQPPLQKQLGLMERYLHRAQVPQSADNEFDSYIHGPPTIFASSHDIIPWIRSQSNPWPGIRQQALDLLSIPATSTELERVFSQSKLTVTPLRNALSDQTLETLELMRYWWCNNIITQQRGGGWRE